MKKFIFTLFVLNICFVATAFSARNRSGKGDEGIYIPQDTLAMMQQKENLSASAAKQAHYHEQIRGKLPDNTISLPQRRISSPPKKKYPPAPIADILAKQHYPQDWLEKYKKNITHSYAIYPNELKVILQKELNTINAENNRMYQIQSNWNNQSPAYKFVNYQINTQIANEISSSRKHFQKREKVFTEFFAKAPTDKPAYIIESTHPLFWLLGTNPQITQYAYRQNIYYISIFDNSYNHLFTYHRMHINANRDRRILASPTGNTEIDNKFQVLFDNYGNDLQKIGLGLDVTNPTLLQQVETMQKGNITETY